MTVDAVVTVAVDEGIVRQRNNRFALKSIVTTIWHSLEFKAVAISGWIETPA